MVNVTRYGIHTDPMGIVRGIIKQLSYRTGAPHYRSPGPKSWWGLPPGLAVLAKKKKRSLSPVLDIAVEQSTSHMGGFHIWSKWMVYNGKSYEHG